MSALLLLSPQDGARGQQSCYQVLFRKSEHNMLQVCDLQPEHSVCFSVFVCPRKESGLKFQLIHSQNLTKQSSFIFSHFVNLNSYFSFRFFPDELNSEGKCLLSADLIALLLA